MAEAARAALAGDVEAVGYEEEKDRRVDLPQVYCGQFQQLHQHQQSNQEAVPARTGAEAARAALAVDVEAVGYEEEKDPPGLKGESNLQRAAWV